MKGLTPKQSEILTYIQHFIEINHYSPSYREIMQHFAFNSPGSVYKHIHTLIRKGALSADKNTSRSLMPIPHSPKKSDQNELKLPLIGNLCCGYPLEVFAKPQLIPVPSHLVHVPDNTYLLQTQGDSLQDEWIRDGDLLIIEARQEAQPGEIILGLINQHDTILKRYYPEGQSIRLESQHPLLPSLTVRSEHIFIQGVLIGLLRAY